jgi:hypothetical protein
LVIYIDSSVALASILAEERKPADALWAAERLFSSRLLQYEVWNRAFAAGIGGTHRGQIESMLRKIDLLDLSQAALASALTPFPLPVRTLDGLHLATALFLRDQGESIELASYDNRMIAAAQAMGIPVAAL